VWWSGVWWSGVCGGVGCDGVGWGGVLTTKSVVASSSNRPVAPLASFGIHLPLPGVWSFRIQAQASPVAPLLLGAGLGASAPRPPRLQDAYSYVFRNLSYDAHCWQNEGTNTECHSCYGAVQLQIQQANNGLLAICERLHVERCLHGYSCEHIEKGGTTTFY